MKNETNTLSKPIEIRRDGKLDVWASYRRHIIPIAFRKTKQAAVAIADVRYWPSDIYLKVNEFLDVEQGQAATQR